MIPKDLIGEIKNRLNSIKGQLDGIGKMLDTNQDPEKIHIQFKAAIKALESTEFLLLDDTFQKSLAIKLSEAMEACPGNCGQENNIERLRKQFPELELDELTQKMKDIQAIHEQIKKTKNVD